MPSSMMALRKETARRYGSADLMWEDVQRHLDGLPVLAHRGTRWYRAREVSRTPSHRGERGGTSSSRRWSAGRRLPLGRPRWPAASATAPNRRLASRTEVTEFLVRLFRTPAPPGASRDQVTARDLLATGTARVEQLAGQPIVQAQMLDALGRVNDQLGRFDDAERMLRRALELRRSQHGDNHVDVARPSPIWPSSSSATSGRGSAHAHARGAGHSGTRVGTEAS